MRMNEFLDSLDSNLSKYSDWIKEWDSLPKSEKIKRLPEMKNLILNGTEDILRMERGEPCIHGDSYERMIVYNSYKEAKIKELGL